MKYIMQSFSVALCSLLICSVSFAKPQKITVDDANKAEFVTAVCETELEVFIPMKSASGYAEWEDGRLNTAKRADEIVAETKEACKAAEKPIKDALNAMKEKWFVKCRAEKCGPSSANNTGEEYTFCDGGEVTVTNRKDEDLKCTYPVKGGEVDPKTLDEGKTEEKCWKGNGPGTRGYSSVLVYIPPQGEEAKYYMNLACRLPGKSGDLSVYEFELVNDKEMPKDDEPKIDEPKKDEPDKLPNK